MPQPHADLSVLGSFRLTVAGRPVALTLSAQRLVSYLALHDGPLLRRHVAGALWSDSSERHAAGSFRSALWRAGRNGASIVEATGSHVRLAAGVRVDLHESRQLARAILAGRHVTLPIDESLLSEDLLPDWTEDWVLIKREYHSQLRLRALETMCERLTDEGRFGDAVQAGLLAVGGEPLRESARRSLIRAHLADGNVAAAARQFSAFRELMMDELHLEPSRELARMLGRNTRITMR